MDTCLFLDLAQSRHPVSCMIPLSGIWLGLSILIFSLMHPGSCRSGRPAGETTPSGAVSPTIATSKWNHFYSAFFYRYLSINYFLQKLLHPKKIPLESRKVLKILLVESIRFRYIIPEIIYPFCHCHPKNLIIFFECGDMMLPPLFYVLYIIL